MLDHLDHLVLTVRDLDATIAFYTQALGMEAITFGAGRRALRFGRQKINLHPVAGPFNPKAAHPTPGSADLCFITSVPLAEVVRRIEQAGVSILEGPVDRTGAAAALQSVYLRDPDGNLIEVANEV